MRQKNRGRANKMAGGLFVDSSAWYPLTVPRHPDHAALKDALTARLQTGVRVTTTNLVIAESQALILKRVGLNVALEFVRRVRTPPSSVVYSTASLEDRAISDWISKFHDQRFSLTDAVSFAVMTDLGITEALTLDRHFAKAGFTVLPPLS